VKKKDTYIAIGVYLMALAITLKYALFNMVIISDQLTEYKLYLMSIDTGAWQFIEGSIVNSCLMVTIIPAYIQRWTGIDPELLFKVYPCFIYSLMPAFSYLIARRYFGVGYSLMVAGLIMSQFYFAFHSSLGRVSIAWGLWAGVIWALLARRYMWVLALGILVIFSHYGNTYIMLAVLMVALGYVIWDKRCRVDIKVLSIILVVLMATTGVWHHAIAKESGRISGGVVKDTLTAKLPPVQEPVVISEKVEEDIIKEAEQEEEIISVPRIEETPGKLASLFSLEYKGEVLQAAFGKALPYMNTPQKIELSLSWLIVLTILLGYVTGGLRKRLSILHLALAGVMFVMIGITMLVPYICTTYGIVRIYFTAMPILAPCFIMGAQEMTWYKKWVGYVFISLLLVAYALCVSGIMHSWFGIIK